MDAVTELVGQGMYMAVAAVAGLGVARILRTDNTLGCLIAGVAAGMLLPILDYDTGLRHDNLKSLIFFVILPVLIFDAAWKIEPGNLLRWLGPILLFSTLGVGICVLLTAVLVYYGINHPAGFPWLAALLTGAILASTDPVSAVGRLKQQSEDAERFLTLLKGESLFNDAMSIVLFTLILTVAIESAANGGINGAEAGAMGLMKIGSMALYFFTTFFGGLFIGLICGLLTAIAVLFLRSASAGLIILVLAAFGSFYLAEHVVHVSGIIAVMVCAIVSRACLREQKQTYLIHAKPTWEWLGLLFTALIFVIMGLVITFDMFTHQWLAMLIAIAAALGARAMAVFMLAPLCRFVGPPVPPAWRVMLSWGGLRGAIAIALVLSLPTELPYWWTVQSMVFGVVLFSILIEGTSSAYFFKKLNL